MSLHYKEDQPLIRRTGDGSPTLISPRYGTTYHSIHGARTESDHVFIAHGLRHWSENHPFENEIRVFEMGFGSGLNALLTCQHSASSGLSIQYRAYETIPLAESVWRSLASELQLSDKEKQWFERMHAGPWNAPCDISSSFCLEKSLADLLLDPPSGRFDLIYYDAFGPETQPELWTLACLDSIIRLLQPEGIFTTYCAKGEVRRSLIALGLQVERLPGPPGKREMLRATLRSTA